MFTRLSNHQSSEGPATNSCIVDKQTGIKKPPQKDPCHVSSFRGLPSDRSLVQFWLGHPLLFFDKTKNHKEIRHDQGYLLFVTLIMMIIRTTAVLVFLGQQVYGQAREDPTGRVLSIEAFGAVADPPRDAAHAYTMEDDDTYHLPDELGDAIAQVITAKGALSDEEDDNKVLERICRKYPPKLPELTVDPSVPLINMQAFNKALEAAQPGDTVLVPDGKIYSTVGGIYAVNKTDITIDIAGSLNFVNVNGNYQDWPYDREYTSSLRNDSNRFYAALALWGCSHVTVTSSSKNLARVVLDEDGETVKLKDPVREFGGLLNGNGPRWWFDALFDCFRLVYGRNRSNPRPRLLYVMESEHIVVENLSLLNSPYWSFSFEVNYGVVRYVGVLINSKYEKSLLDARGDKRLKKKLRFRSRVSKWWQKIRRSIWGLAGDVLEEILGHNPLALNTDGIDPAGSNILIHDCIVSNSDDSIAVKPCRKNLNTQVLPDCTNNVTMENLILTGFGASIGSVPPNENHNCVKDVLFRNISMPHTGRGIYVKSNGSPCTPPLSSEITNIRYEDVTMIEPKWWPIWIGPQQQQQPGEDLGLKCSLFYPLDDRCPVPACATFTNISLSNIRMQYPTKLTLGWPWVGAVFGNEADPNMEDIHFDNVVATPLLLSPRRSIFKLKRSYKECVGATGTQKGSSPDPSCLLVIAEGDYSSTSEEL